MVWYNNSRRTQTHSNKPQAQRARTWVGPPAVKPQEDGQKEVRPREAEERKARQKGRTRRGERTPTSPHIVSPPRDPHPRRSNEQRERGGSETVRTVRCGRDR